MPYKPVWMLLFSPWNPAAGVPYVCPLPPLRQFALGEVYASPNPARAAERPILHIEVGIADVVEIRLFAVSGELVQEATLAGPPVLAGDGRGLRYTYEHELDVSALEPGAYVYAIVARRKGQGSLRAAGKLEIVG